MMKVDKMSALFSELCELRYTTTTVETRQMKEEGNNLLIRPSSEVLVEKGMKQGLEELGKACNNDHSQKARFYLNKL